MGTPDNCGWEEELTNDAKNYSELKPKFSCTSNIIPYLRNTAPQF